MGFKIFQKGAKGKGSSQRTQKIIQEDLIKAIYKHEQTLANKTDLIELATSINISPKELNEAIGQLALEGYLLVNPFRLTKQGDERALQLIRQHRIYELYLAEHSGYNAEEWHTQAEVMEHKLSEAEVKELEKLLGHPLFDPHGDPIPNAELQLAHQPSPSETALELGKIFKVLHIEDDDLELFKVIHNTGLARHALIKIEEINAEDFSFSYEGESFRLPKEAIEALTLKEADEEEKKLCEEKNCKRLSSLKEGEEAEIIGLSPSCRGAMRRRLMDLGFVRGSVVQIDMTSPMNNPIAYVVRGAAIALRRDQARYILVKELKHAKAE